MILSHLYGLTMMTFFTVHVFDAGCYYWLHKRESLEPVRHGVSYELEIMVANIGNGNKIFLVLIDEWTLIR